MLSAMPVAVNGKPRLAPGDVYAGKVSLRGIHPEDLPLMWIWLNEYPRANFDDYGPQTLPMFEAEIIQRITRREFVVIVLHEDKPVGAVGYATITERLGSLRGICFSKKVHGKGVAAFAVRALLARIFADGKVQKIEAQYFKDNQRIKKFLRKLGFVHEGTKMDHTVRGGRPIDVSLVALYRRNWKAE